MTVKDLSLHKLYLLALSGGADSIALALMMKEQGLDIHALHCNFHLRGEESDRDEKFVREFCQQHCIQLEVKHFDTLASAKEHKTSIEMEARELRYAWFAERAIQLNAEAVCVAHHKDDQAETLLLNLIRGTGLKGLAAMHQDRTVKGLRILRPLLDITKDEILEFLSYRQQAFVTDSTNLERDALRNRIRLDVMPMLRELNPNITDCLARTADNVRMELDSESQESHYHHWLAPLGFTRSQILDIYAHRPNGKLPFSTNHTNVIQETENGKQTAHLSNCPSETGSEEGLSEEALNVLPYPLRGALPSATLDPEGAHRAEGGDKNHRSSSHRSSGLTWHSATHTLLLDRGEWLLRSKEELADKPLPQLITKLLPLGTKPTLKDFTDRKQAFIDGDNIVGEVVLRLCKPGDRFRPYGMKKGSRLISDYLTDKKVSLLDKKCQLVAVDNATDNIVWVVNREIDHRYRVTSDSTHILCLSISEQ